MEGIIAHAFKAPTHSKEVVELMNPNIKHIKEDITAEFLRLTSKGYSTREAKRKIARDYKKRTNTNVGSK